ncbi:hypothetical protein GCM10010339_94150 [Streptomyces alanosinicus]|uniref:Uncharacterized protein n=1 Tax=Streptomyces alanosinicus TaxID=68171 RepID=A0A918MI74_9ACTN|nr:hypothetical protein GCM10010339_94150 [Streptomyces alanosinicus]
MTPPPVVRGVPRDHDVDAGGACFFEFGPASVDAGLVVRDGGGCVSAYGCRFETTSDVTAAFPRGPIVAAALDPSGRHATTTGFTQTDRRTTVFLAAGQEVNPFGGLHPGRSSEMLPAQSAGGNGSLSTVVR